METSHSEVRSRVGLIPIPGEERRDKGPHEGYSQVSSEI